MSSQNWRTEVDASDYFGHRQKQLNINDRKPLIRRASDIVGPGIGANAVRISDFSNTLATFNGFYSAAAGAYDAPTPEDPYAGWVVGDKELGGVQMFYSLADGTGYRRTFQRNPADSASIIWGVWQIVYTYPIPTSG